MDYVFSSLTKRTKSETQSAYKAERCEVLREDSGMSVIAVTVAVCQEDGIRNNF